jgi:hypothetical protein
MCATLKVPNTFSVATIAAGTGSLLPAYTCLLPPAGYPMLAGIGRPRPACSAGEICSFSAHTAVLARRAQYFSHPCTSDILVTCSFAMQQASSGGGGGPNRGVMGGIGGGGGGVGGGGAGGAGAGGTRNVPAWLQRGTMLGDANAKLLESCPEQISTVAPPIVVVGVVGAFMLGGAQVAVVLALVYFFSSQQGNPQAQAPGQGNQQR